MENDNVVNEKSNYTATVILAIVILLVGIFIFKQNKQPTSDIQENSVVVEDNNMTEPTPIKQTGEKSDAMATSDNVKTFTVKASNFKFDTPQIKVSKGDVVQIVFINEQGIHDWRVDEFKAATEILKEPGTQTIEFTADKAGTFEYYCSVMEHRKMGMVGNLVVE